jgi:hypothetical protein
MLAATQEGCMSVRDDFLRHLEAEIAAIKQHLRPLESHDMIIRQGPPGFMADVTSQEVQKLKNSIARIEAVIAQYRDGLADMPTGTQGPEAPPDESML